MKKDLDMSTRKNILKKLVTEYRIATRKQKSQILDDYVKLTGHNRKYVIAELNKPNILKPKLIKKKPGYRGKYNDIEKPLEFFWKIFNYPCGQRLQSILKTETRRIVKFGDIKLTENQISKMEQIGSATIDRKLKARKKMEKSKLYSATKPGYMLKSQIPIKTNGWNDRAIGFSEVDLVVHCGTKPNGQYINTLSFVDVCTGWWEGVGVMGKSALVVNNGIEQIRNRIPFKIKGIDSDNGSEFINELLFKYCKSKDICFTRGRSGRKNDNCHVEQKNWTHVRKLLGYKRFDTNGELELINSIYELFRLYFNFFQPTYKLELKVYNDSKRIRKYEKDLKTPYQRLLESKDIKKADKSKLISFYETLNPVNLKKQIDKYLNVLAIFNSKKHELKQKVANLN